MGLLALKQNTILKKSTFTYNYKILAKSDMYLIHFVDELLSFTYCPFQYRFLAIVPFSIDF